LQLSAFNPDAGTCITPERLEIGFRQHCSPLVAELPPPNNCTSIHDARGETEREQHAHTVGVDQKPGTQSVPSLLALDEFRREAVLM
jgi:hypothetical protein